MAESSTPSCGRWPRARCSLARLRPAAIRAVGLLEARTGSARSGLTLLFLAAILAAGSLSVVSAQTVQGRLTDSGTGEPVEGALVLLIDSDGEQAGGYLTNPAGLFLIRAPFRGTFTLRSERIGYATVVSDPFVLEQSEQLTMDLSASQKAIELTGIRVEGDQRCVVRPQEGERLASVWDEARKALAGQEWAEREGLFRFRMTDYSRTLDPSTLAIEDETRRSRTGIAGSPIRSLPVDDLMTNGFVRRNEEGGYTYYGPDASVMLSDRFLDTHCFRLVARSERPEEVGLGFEPIEPGGLPDIKGVLWLDVQTFELLDLEYGYTWSPWLEVEGIARGHIDFVKLPGGAWVIPGWWIRMPIVVVETVVHRDGRGQAVSLQSIREVGGIIEEYSPVESPEATGSNLFRASLEGVVWDNTLQAPLAEATVFLSGTPFSARTDSLGWYLLEDLPAGVYSATFTHSRLDSLGVYYHGLNVDLTPGRKTEANLGIPISAPGSQPICSPEDLAQDPGVVIGHVRDARTNEAMEGVIVQAGWSVVPSAESNAREEQKLGAPTDATGRYTLCGVPLDTRLSVRAELNEVNSEAVRILANPDGLTVVDLLLGGG